MLPKNMFKFNLYTLQPKAQKLNNNKGLIVIYHEPFPIVTKKVISLTDRDAEKHVQNSVCMPCNQRPVIK